VINKFWFEAKNINCFKNGYKVIKDLNLKILSKFLFMWLYNHLIAYLRISNDKFY